MSVLPEDTTGTEKPSAPLVTNAGKIEISDPTELELTSHPWEVMVKPLDNNPFLHQKDYLMTPSTILYKESYTSAVQIQGLTPDRMFGFTIPIQLGKHSLFWNNQFDGHELPASMPGGLDVVLDAKQIHIVVLIDISLLEQMLTRAQFQALSKAASLRKLPINNQALCYLTQWLLHIFNYAQRRNDIFQHPSVLRSIEEDLLQQLVRIFRSPQQVSSLDSRQKRRQGFDSALEFLREADLSSIKVSDLCDQTGVSQRTLEYAFREQFNMTPVRFIRKLRLHAIRRTLMSSDLPDISISDTAFEYGIYEMGRFASIYKKQFGELPSETLVKPLIRADSHLVY